MQGWLKLHRSLAEHWIYKDAEYLKVWIEMLVRARHSEEPTTEMIEGQLVTINYGEFIFGRPGWSKRLGISEQRLRTLIKKMTDDGMIESTSKFHKFSLYRIKNYQKFNQLDNQQSNQQKDLAEQGIEEANNQQNNQLINLQSTSSQPASNQQLTTKEECKELKNDKKEKKLNNKPKISFSEFVKLTQEEHDKLVAQHGQSKTERMIEILNNYKGANGKKYKSDYMAILNWVVDRVEQENNKKITYGSNRTNKTSIPIIQDIPKAGPVTPEQLEEMRKIARKLDGKEEVAI